MFITRYQVWRHKETKDVYLVLPTRNGCKAKNQNTRKWEDSIMYQKLGDDGLVTKSIVYVREYEDFREKFEFIDTILPKKDPT